MTEVDEKNGRRNGDVPQPRFQPMEPPSPDQLRLARANLLEALTVKFNNLFTTIVANCDMALTELDQAHGAVAYLLSAKHAAYQASEANSRVIALVKECREAHK